MSDKPLLVILGERTAIEVLETAQSGYQEQFQDIEKCYFEPTKFVADDVPRLTARSTDIYFHAGVASEPLKRAIVDACQGAGWRPFTIVHPSAVISPSATLGQGVFVGPLAVVSSHAAIGDFALVHIHASVGHDAIVGKFSSILPGARISGKVVLGERVLIGSNAFVAAGITIEDDSQVDALTYVNRDIPARHIVSIRAKMPVARTDLR